MYVIYICISAFRHILSDQKVNLEEDCRKYSRSRAKTSSPKCLTVEIFLAGHGSRAV
jgi:hypothetical protein